MVNYKYIFAVGASVLLPISVAADTCSTLPTCESIGFTYSAGDCGKLKKLKCPFGDAYFCSGTNCKSVSVSSTEKCTKWCEEDKNICVEKRAMTCSELLSANNCTRYNHNSTISGTISRDICVFGTVKQATGYYSSLTFTQVNVYDAGLRFPACESEMTGRAKLDLGYIKITNYASFYTDLDIDSITYSPQGSTNNWHANFYGNTRIRVMWQGSTTWGGTLNLYFQGRRNATSGITTKTTNQVVISCVAVGDRWSPSQCNVNIDNYDADVTYCGMVESSTMSCGSGGYDTQCYGENVITCNDGYSDNTYGVCKEENSYGYCSYYWN